MEAFALLRYTLAFAPLPSIDGLRRGHDIVFLVLLTEGIFLHKCSAPLQSGFPLQHDTLLAVLACSTTHSLHAWLGYSAASAQQAQRSKLVG